MAQPAFATPQLFGAGERWSADISAFRKWTGVLQRFGAGDVAQDSGVAALLQRVRKLPVRQQLEEVNRYHNRRPYIQDMVNWGMVDYWEIPPEFLVRNGDCEDYAIAKYMTLKRLGIPINHMRIVVLQDLNLGVLHSVLAVYEGDTIYILDNQLPVVVEHTRIRHYRPVYSVNEQSWWRYLPR